VRWTREVYLSLTAEQSVCTDICVGAVMDHTELLENIMERTKSLRAVRLVFYSFIFLSRIYISSYSYRTSKSLNLSIHDRKHRLPPPPPPPLPSLSPLPVFLPANILDTKSARSTEQAEDLMTKSAEGSEPSHPSKEWVQDDVLFDARACPFSMIDTRVNFGPGCCMGG
jgi:hypothetical protein